jgi:serine/threonine protein kinase
MSLVIPLVMWSAPVSPAAARGRAPEDRASPEPSAASQPRHGLALAGHVQGRRRGNVLLVSPGLAARYSGMTDGAVLDEPLRAALLPELEPIRLLGSGATAHVYLAREPALARLVAADAVARQRFEREAQSAARIAHPHVTAIYRVGRVPDGRPYIVMEYVEGRTLTDVLAAGGVYEEPAARELLAALASALTAAHEKGVIHRDVRPANVLLENRTGRAVLGDFGVAGLLDSGSAAAARLTTAGMVLGDPRYHSPEQVRGEPAVELHRAQRPVARQPCHQHVACDVLARPQVAAAAAGGAVRATRSSPR